MQIQVEEEEDNSNSAHYYSTDSPASAQVGKVCDRCTCTNGTSEPLLSY